jgi:hypothetical protein
MIGLGCRRITAELVQRLIASLFAEQIEQSFAGEPIGQRGDLVLRARLPERVQRAGDAVRVTEGGVLGRH